MIQAFCLQMGGEEGPPLVEATQARFKHDLASQIVNRAHMDPSALVIPMYIGFAIGGAAHPKHPPLLFFF